MKYKEIVFDFDGTLVDSVTALLEWLKAGNANVDLPPLDEDSIERYRNMEPEYLMKEIGLSKFQMIRLMGKLIKYLKENPQTLKVIDGIPDVLNQLKEDYVLGVLSSNKEDVINGVFELNNIDLFEYISAGAALWSKEVKMLKLLDQRNLDPSEMLYIGDEVKDVEGARKAGIDIISVTTGYNTFEALDKINKGMVARDPKEIIEIINKAYSEKT